MNLRPSIQRVLNGVIGLLLFGILLSQSQAQVGPPPVIIAQPLDVTVPIESDAVFEVVAVSGTTLSYQWRKDGHEINGAKKSTYTVSRARATDAGRYSVEVKNAAGAVVSSNAILDVISPNVPLRFASSEMTTNGFRMQLSGPVSLSYVIWASSDLTNWTSISTNAAPKGTLDFTDTSARNHNLRFYRALVR